MIIHLNWNISFRINFRISDEGRLLEQFEYLKDKDSRAAGARPKLVRNRQSRDGINRTGVKKMGSKGSGSAVQDRRRRELDLFRDRPNDDEESGPSTDPIRWCLMPSLIETPGGIDQKAKWSNTDVPAVRFIHFRRRDEITSGFPMRV